MKGVYSSQNTDEISFVHDKLPKKAVSSVQYYLYVLWQFSKLRLDG
jgi:hypothetical protein